MILKNIPLIIIVLFFKQSLSAQSQKSEDYLVAAAALNDLVAKIDFNYYFPDAPLDPLKDPYPLHPDSIYVMFDPETYEETTYTGKALIAERKAAYQKESKLYRLRAKTSKKMILVGTFLEVNLHKKRGNYNNIPADIPLENLRAFDWQPDQLPVHPDYVFKKSHQANSTQYKYLIAAYVWMSNVLYNQNHDKALMEFGYHYKLENGGTGGGGQILLAKVNGQWKLEKWFGIWEE